MKLAKGTSSWLAVAWIATAALFAATATIHPYFLGPAILALACAIILLNFFRDPERDAAPGICASADGVVQSIDAQPDGGVRVATFMNPFNVHVNRAPIAGRVVEVKHVPGGFIPAFNKDAERNERVEWRFETEVGEIRLVQIAGTLARRIVPYLAAGEKVNKGDRIGIIRLGSRVDVYLPPGVLPVVRVGEKVHAGTTQIAELR